MSENMASGRFWCQKCGHVQDWQQVVGMIDQLGYPRAIHVGERLPERRTSVLAYEAISGRWYEAYFTKEGDFSATATCGDKVGYTHWLPMPPKPE